MAMVNMNNLLNMKDSRWLQLEVCREFQRNKCSRPDTECKFAHPPVNVEVQNGRVTACYDSIKGRCNREKPPCKYFHPPLHLKDQLLINGRNHLALKNALMQQMGMAPGQGVVPGQVPTVATNPYLGVTNSYNPYFSAGPLVSLVSDPSGAPLMSPLGVPQQAVLQQKNFPGMVTYKRPAEKGGVPVYPAANSASAAAYQHLMQLQQPFVPVSSSSIQQHAHHHQLSLPLPPPPSHHHHQTTSTTNPTTLNILNSESNGGESVNVSQSSGDLDTLPVKKIKPETLEDGGSNNNGGTVDEIQATTSHQQTNGVIASGGSGTSSCGDVGGEEESKELEAKRMRVSGHSGHGTSSASILTGSATATIGSGNSGNATAVMVGNNAAYAAAAQNYHSALAAMTYTGANLQANKVGPPPPHTAVQSALYPGLPVQAAAAAAAAAAASSQHQLLQQYQQAMAAAAFATGGAGGSFPGTTQQNPNVATQLGGGLSFVNPYLAALPQLAAAQRAQLLAGHAAAAGAGAFGSHAGIQGLQGAAAAFTPFGLQLGGHGTGLTPNLSQLTAAQTQQQQALLAAYGGFAAGRGPAVVSAAPTLTHPLYIGNPVAPGGGGPLQAAAAAAAAAGVKRMRPG